MKRLILAACGLAAVVSLASGEARAQSGGVAAGPDPSTVRDAEDVRSAKHELEVARHYFKNKKAYLASFKRADELIAGYPEFPQIDEALYIAGTSALYLLEGKGKQALPKAAPEDENALTPEHLRAAARDYFGRIIDNYPNSEFRKQAQEALGQLGASAAAGEKKQ
ncbi:MAG TPA: outer membrane protein assembly factor BamD [Pyrinomonadaceae bacterium]|jgi:outer membrane protein assembly factor BamD (BamD/ComL family)|nr:outer membrane protein assembly factor BamD [Pyrinomonadaceae bacterium]